MFYRVSWELEGSHGNLKREPCLTGSHASWELEGSHGNLEGLMGT